MRRVHEPSPGGAYKGRVREWAAGERERGSSTRRRTALHTLQCVRFATLIERHALRQAGCT